jgi:hypothetical protein
MKRTTVGLFGLILLTACGVSTADVIRISTDSSFAVPSVTLDCTPGEACYVLETGDPSRFIDIHDASPEEDFVVLFGIASPFSLRRDDGAPFSLLSLRYAGEGEAIVGGVSLPLPGLNNFQNFAFSGQPGVTDVTSVVFMADVGPPETRFQIAAFEVAVIPEPDSFVLLTFAVLGFSFMRLFGRESCL